MDELVIRWSFERSDRRLHGGRRGGGKGKKRHFGGFPLYRECRSRTTIRAGTAARRQWTSSRRRTPSPSSKRPLSTSLLCKKVGAPPAAIAWGWADAHRTGLASALKFKETAAQLVESKYVASNLLKSALLQSILLLSALVFKPLLSNTIGDSYNARRTSPGIAYILLHVNLPSRSPHAPADSPHSSSGSTHYASLPSTSPGSFLSEPSLPLRI